MALVNPNIAMSFRQPEFQVPNALAQYAQIQQIQGGQQAQELARFQLGAAQRAESVQNALTDAYASSIDPTGNIDYNRLVGSLAKGGGASQIPGVLKTKAETTAAQLAQKKTQGEIDKNQFDLQDKKLKFAWNAVGASTTPEAAIAELTKGVKDGIFDMRSATEEIQRVRSLNPDQYRQYRIEKVMGILDAKDKLGFMLPKTVRQDAGGQILSIQDNPMMPGYGQPIAGAAITKTPTIGERTGQGQLSLAQQKFAFEQANPGFELKEAEDGSIVGVNKRTLQAFPVSIGGAAPAAPGAGMPGPRMPSPATQAIPGMTSVLDQPAPAAGVPLRGKGTALTESQGNATAYGMRMKEANAILEDLSKKGVLKGAVVESTPLVGGVLGRSLPSVLGGTSEAQQQVNQAKANFITAVLRKESGAVISDSEFDRENEKYFPQINDNEAVIKQKANARKTAIRAMEIQAGPGARQMGGAGIMPGVGAIPGASATNPFGLPGIN